MSLQQGNNYTQANRHAYGHKTHQGSRKHASRLILSDGIGLEGTHPQVRKNYTSRCLQRLRVRSELLGKLTWRANATGKGKNRQINQHDWKQTSKKIK
jgi:hypothetical protein